jgi:glycine cleavage system H protein
VLGEFAVNDIPIDLQYTRSHEWVRRLPNGQVEVGITDHAQGSLGDLVFVEVPEVGRQLKAGESCAVVESVKAASDVYSPVSGKVTASNADLASRPELLNQEPYGAGWLMRVEVDACAVGAALMSAGDYARTLSDAAE